MVSVEDQMTHNNNLDACIRMIEFWMDETYDSAEELGQVDDLMVEAGRIMEDLGLNENRTVDMNDMINALSFVQTYKDEYF